VIAAITQSWTVISGAADPTRAHRAMQSLDEHLVRPHDKLVLRLTSPFDMTRVEPGYMKGYVPGIRDNGAHHSHAAVWSVIALAALGDSEKAAEVFAVLNAFHHLCTPHDMVSLVDDGRMHEVRVMMSPPAPMSANES